MERFDTQVVRVVKTCPLLRLPLVNKKSAFVLCYKASKGDIKIKLPQKLLVRNTFLFYGRMAIHNKTLGRCNVYRIFQPAQKVGNPISTYL